MTHTHTRAIALFVALAIPLPLLAATLHIEPSIAGLGLDIAVRSAQSNEALSIVLKDPDGRSTTVPTQADTTGGARVSIPGKHTETAGAYTVSAVNAQRTVVASSTVTVDAETMDPWTSEVQAWTPRIQADGTDAADVSVTLRDRYGNALAGRPVALLSSRSEDSVEARTPHTNAEGIQHFAVYTQEPGTMQLRAIDLLSGNTIVESAEVTAGGYAMGGYAAPESTASERRFYSPYGAQTTSPFGVLEGFEVIAPATLTVNEEAPKITIRAIDRDGNTIENYNGTVVFKTTDPQATVPNFGEYTFKERDLGQKSFPLTLKFRTPGDQTLRVEDKFDDRIMGEADISVTGSGPSAGQIQIFSHANDEAVNSTAITLEGVGPRYANLIVTGGIQDATGSTGPDGSFAIAVALNPSYRDHTLRIRDDAGRYDSGSLHLTLDQVKPIIKRIQFVPQNPEEGENVLVVVESEYGLRAAVLRLPSNAADTAQEIVLAANPSASGSYQAFFSAPPAGVYQPAAVVTDRAGNTDEVRAELVVGGKSLPIVQNVRAEPRVNGVEVTWDPVPGEVSGYNVYVGESTTDFYALPTERAVTKANVRGLTPGKTYYFAVTAVRGDQESAEKSAIMQSQVLGFTLDVQADDGALTLSWTSLSTDLPLSSFLLEYGTEEQSLTESRMLHSELRTFTIRDLLPGVQYFARITPITVTGDKMDELAANGSGTPTGAGFVPSTRDDIPSTVSTRPGNVLHGAPNNPQTGIPPIAWMSAVAVGIGGMWLRMQRRRKIAQTQEFLQAVHTKYGTL